jgi:hypothetical protein
MKKINLTESDLHRIVKESIRRVLKEEIYDGWDNEPLLDGYYVAIETIGYEDTICTVVERNEAEDLQNSSAGYVDGPYNTYEDAMRIAQDYAEKEGYHLIG